MEPKAGQDIESGWQVGTDDPEPFGETVAPLRIDEQFEATDTWEVTDAKKKPWTASKLNKPKVVVENTERGGKKTMIDKVWLEVTCTAR